MKRFEVILYEKEDGIARITINRPEVRNALDERVVSEMMEAFEDADKDESIKAIVLTGAGEKAFSSGADIGMFQRMVETGQPEFKIREHLTNVIRLYKLMEQTKPIIAVVKGWALAGGFEMTQLCDLVICSEDARFGQPEININIIPGLGTMLPRFIPMNKAKEICFTGDFIDAKEAERLGFVNKVVPKDKFEEAVKELLDKLRTKSATALRLCKAALNLNPINYSQGLEYTRESCALTFALPEAKKAFEEFLKRRK